MTKINNVHETTNNTGLILLENPHPPVGGVITPNGIILLTSNWSDWEEWVCLMRPELTDPARVVRRLH